MKLLKGPIGLLLFGLLLGGVATFGAARFMGDSLPFAKKPAAAAEAKPKEPEHGMMYPMKERIVNLADPGVMRYLKTTIVLELAHHGDAPLPKGDEYKKKQDELVKEMKAHAPIIEDQINVILTAKTSGEVMTTEGKQKLKDEIKSQVNKALHKDEVLAVYFSDFIVQ